METKCQYLFVITPPAHLAEEIHKIRMAFAAQYNCKAALKPPVHITLIPNFWIFPRTEERILWLNEWAATLPPFTVSLRNFGTFRQREVVFIDVEKSTELETLHNGLLLVKNSLPSGTFRPIASFNPHITIGYRDIPKELYEQAVEDYMQKTFSADFTVNQFELWRHNGQKWETLHSYKM